MHRNGGATQQAVSTPIVNVSPETTGGRKMAI